MEAVSFDPQKQKAVLRCSICTGEQVAGFKDLQTGKFEEVLLIQKEEDLELFQKKFHITEMTKEY